MRRTLRGLTGGTGLSKWKKAEDGKSRETRLCPGMCPGTKEGTVEKTDRYSRVTETQARGDNVSFCFETGSHSSGASVDFLPSYKRLIASITS